MIESRVLPNLTTALSSERRLSQRLTVAAQIELRIKNDSVPIRSKTTDLSVGGCYIEMGVTLEPGTPLDVVLWLEHEKLVLQGRIVTKHPQFGNGIEFIGVSPEAETCLQRFLGKAENSRVI
jgi:c-di-GMP-binding flagellar brake protein YcgR